MTTFAIANWTARKTSGPYWTLDAARERLSSVCGGGDEYSIWAMPHGGHTGSDVESSFYRP